MGFFDDIEESLEFDATPESKVPIPEGANVLAVADEALWKEPNQWVPNSYIQIRWEVIDGEHKGRKVFQKLYINDDDEKKQRKAIAMLSAIDQNCGGYIRKANEVPDDALLSTLLNHPMYLKLGVWKNDDASGNWVMAIGSTKKQRQQPQLDLNEELTF